eukprot:g1689.t1
MKTTNDKSSPADSPADIAKLMWKEGKITDEEYSTIVSRDALFRGRKDSLDAFRKEEEERRKRLQPIVAAEKMYKDGIIDEDDFKRLADHASMYVKSSPVLPSPCKNSLAVADGTAVDTNVSPFRRALNWMRSPHGAADSAVVTASARSGSTPTDAAKRLALACRRADAKEAQEILLNRPELVDMCADRNDFRTPMHIAAATKSLDIVNVLLKFGANLRKLDSKKRSAVNEARTRVVGRILAKRCLDTLNLPNFRKRRAAAKKSGGGHGSDGKTRKIRRRGSSVFERPKRLFDYFANCRFRIGRSGRGSIRIVGRTENVTGLAFETLHVEDALVSFIPCGGAFYESDVIDLWWRECRRRLRQRSMGATAAGSGCVARSNATHTFALTVAEPKRNVYVTATIFSLRRRDIRNGRRSGAAMYPAVASALGFEDVGCFLLVSHHPIVELPRKLLCLLREHCAGVEGKISNAATVLDRARALLRSLERRPIVRNIAATSMPLVDCGLDADRGLGFEIPTARTSKSLSSSSTRPTKSTRSPPASPTKNAQLCRSFASQSVGSLRTLFTLLSPVLVAKLVGILLQEKNLILFSEHSSLLTPCCEALLSLMWPLTWSGVYVPLLPLSLITMCDTPVPFLLGTHASNLLGITRFANPGQVYEQQYTSVDLDNGQVVWQRGVVMLPAPLVTQFASRVAAGLLPPPTSTTSPSTQYRPIHRKRHPLWLPFAAKVRNFYEEHGPERLRSDPSFLSRTLALYHRHQQYLFRRLSAKYSATPLAGVSSSSTQGSGGKSIPKTPSGRLRAYTERPILYERSPRSAVRLAIHSPPSPSSTNRRCSGSGVKTATGGVFRKKSPSLIYATPRPSRRIDATDAVRFSRYGLFFLRAAGVEMMYALLGSFQVYRAVPDLAQAIHVDVCVSPTIAGDAFRDLRMTMSGANIVDVDMNKACGGSSTVHAGLDLQRIILGTQHFRMYTCEYLSLVSACESRKRAIDEFDRYVDMRNSGSRWIDAFATVWKATGSSNFAADIPVSEVRRSPGTPIPHDERE